MLTLTLLLNEILGWFQDVLTMCMVIATWFAPYSQRTRLSRKQQQPVLSFLFTSPSCKTLNDIISSLCFTPLVSLYIRYQYSYLSFSLSWYVENYKLLQYNTCCWLQLHCSNCCLSSFFLLSSCSLFFNRWIFHLKKQNVFALISKLKLEFSLQCK